MSTLFLKLAKLWQREMANSSISTIKLKFEDVPARNTFEYLQNWFILPETRVIDLHFCRW